MKTIGLLLAIFGAGICLGQNADLAGIAHVAFRVADLEAARAFYGKLGFEEFFAMKQGDRVTEAFLKVNDHQFLELYPQTDPSQAIGLMHVCYESNDLEALHAHYVARGLTVSDVRKAGAGNLLMTMKDLEGQTIEFTQYMPGSRHYEDRGKHLGTQRMAQTIVGAASPARDAATVREFYSAKLGFAEVGGHLQIPGASGEALDIVEAGPGVKPGILFGVGAGQKAPASMRDPNGVVVSFTQSK